MTGTQRRVVGLLAVATWLTIDLIRFAGPMISQLFDIGVEVAAGSAVATFAGGSALAWFATLVGRRVGHGNVALAIVAALVVLRVLLPFLSSDALVLYGLITLAMSLALLLLAVRGVGAAGGPPTIMGAVGVGAMIAVVEQGAVRTWDAIWRTDVLGVIETVLLCVALLLTAWRSRNDHSEVPTRGLWALGLWLSLCAFAFVNLAFLSSQSGYHLAVAIMLAAVGLAAGTVIASRAPNMPQPAVVAIGAGTVLAVFTLVTFQGAVLIVMAPAAIAGTTYITSRVLAVGVDGSRSGVRYLGAAATFGLLTVLPFMLVQLDYDIPLGFPHLMVVVASVAALMVGSAWNARRKEKSQVLTAAAVGFRRRAGIVGIASVLASVATLITFAGGGGTAGPAPSELRVISWNLHYGVTPDAGNGPDVAIAAIAGEIASHNPDVVIIQEMTRGWILAGGTDMLQLLGDALGMNYVYVGAHDHQFGNAILSRYELTDVETHELPYGTGPQRRSAIVATVATANGPIQFTSIHLQHKDDDATRVLEAEAFLADVTPADAAVVAGDFNDTPDSDVVALMLERFGSAQDDTIGGANTYVGADFQDRIDYAFYDGVTITDFEVGDSPLSDHLALIFTVSVSGS